MKMQIVAMLGVLLFFGNSYAVNPVEQEVKYNQNFSFLSSTGFSGTDRSGFIEYTTAHSEVCPMPECSGALGPSNATFSSNSSDPTKGMGKVNIRLGLNNLTGESLAGVGIMIGLTETGTCTVAGLGLTEQPTTPPYIFFGANNLATQIASVLLTCTKPIGSLEVAAASSHIASVSYTVNGIKPDVQNTPPKGEACEGGSIIGIDSRSLGESIPIVGTDFSLNYSTKYVRDYAPAYQVYKKLRNDSITQSMDVQLVVAGRTISQTIVADPTTYLDYVWDGLDSSSASFDEPQLATLTVTGSTSNDSQSFEEKIPLGVYRPQKFGMPGWTISAHHYYNKITGQLFLGTANIEMHEYEVLTGGNLMVVSNDGSEVFIFDTNGKHLETKTSLTGATKYTFGYDGSSRLTTITNAYSKVTTLSRSSGVLTGIVGPYGQTTSITVNGSGQIENLANPKSETYYFTYKSGTDLMATFAKPGLQTSTFTYDTDGTLSKDEGAGGNFWTIFKDVLAAGKPILKSSQMGRETKYETGWNQAGIYQRTSTEPNGLVTTYEESDYTKSSSVYGESLVTTAPDERFGGLYRRTTSSRFKIWSLANTTDYAVSVAGMTDPFTFTSITKTATTDGRVTTEVYDPSTKTFTTTTPEGVISALTIDLWEKPVSSQLGTDKPWSMVYDADGRISQVKQDTRHENNFVYNSDGTLQLSRDPLGRETSYTYDLAGRVLTVTYPDAGVLVYTYDVNGNVTGVTPPTKPIHNFDFNLFELPSEYKPPMIGFTPKDTSYAYNLDKQLTLITRPTGQTAAYAYDATTGNLSTITTAEGTYATSYYSAGSDKSKLQNFGSPYGIKSVYVWTGPYVSREEQRKRSDNNFIGAVDWYFNEDNLPSSRVSTVGASTNSIDYTYNDDLQPVTVGDLSLTYTYPSGRLWKTAIGQISDERTYDDFGALASYSSSFTDPVTSVVKALYSYSLTRDALGRISQKVETIGGKTVTYDYDYDVNGRLTESRRNTIVDAHFDYDENGNRITGMSNGGPFTGIYDDQDRLQSLAGKVYTYNKNGDLSQIAFPFGASAYYSYDVFGNLKQFIDSAGNTYDYVMDAQNRRVAKKNAAGDILYRYIYEGDYRIAVEFNETSGSAKHYFYIPGNHSPDYMTYAGDKYRIIKDHLGSPRLVVKITDGEIKQRVDYSEIGIIMWDTNSCFTPFGFAGGIYDNNSKIYRFGARDYDPRSTGRWLSKDPILFNGGDFNLYGYANNDPINFIDPDGLAPSSHGNQNFVKLLAALEWLQNGHKWEENRMAKERQKENLDVNLPNYTPAKPPLPKPFDPDLGGPKSGGKCKYNENKAYPFMDDL